MNTTDKPIDLDTVKLGKAANALAERNDEHDATKLAAERINQIVTAASTAALTGVNNQIEALRNLGRMIERRRDALTEAAAEHARFCHDTCKSEEIMREAIDSLHKSFANGLPPSLRLVPTEDR